MSGILSSLAVATKVLDAFSDDGKMTKEKMAKLSKDVQFLSADGSMVKIINKTIIEPVAIISKDLKSDDITESVLDINIDIFSSFYMQVYNILTGVYGEASANAMTMLSTNQTAGGQTRKYLLNKYIESNEDFGNVDFFGELEDGFMYITTEARGGNPRGNPRMTPEQLKAKQEKLAERAKSLSSDKTRTRVNDDIKIANAIQKTIDVTVVKDMNGSIVKFIIPVIIKTNIIYTDEENILNLADTKNDSKRFGSRWQDFKSTAISFTDLIFAGDLIKKYKKNKLNDKDNLIKMVNERIASSNAKLLNHGYMGFEKYYNMFIIPVSTKIKLEKIVHGKINNTRYKEKLAEQLNALLITVVDQDYERVQIFTKDLKGSTDITFRTLKKRSNNNNNEDMSEIFKSMLQNRTPQF